MMRYAAAYAAPAYAPLMPPEADADTRCRRLFRFTPLPALMLPFSRRLFQRLSLR